MCAVNILQCGKPPAWLLNIYHVPCFMISSRCSIGIIDEYISLNIPFISLTEEIDYAFWSKKLSLTDLDIIGRDMRQLVPRHPCGGFGVIGRDVWPHLLTKLTAFILSFCKIMMHKSFRGTPWPRNCRTRQILLSGFFPLRGGGTPQFRYAPFLALLGKVFPGKA